MKLVRYGRNGHEKPGLIDSAGRLHDLSGHVDGISWEQLSRPGMKRLAAIAAGSLPLVPGKPRLGVPFTGISKIVAVGLNYREHAAETGAPVPSEPVLFMKATTCINGPHDAIVMPPGSVKTDWEVELGIVIGREARRVARGRALDHVAGYCVVHDVSERAYQKERGGTWDKGKGCDTYGPLGPWLVSRDEVADPQRLHLWLDVNDERMQDGNTADMIFPCDELISYISHFMTLRPGDVIATGTPPGVGMGRTPPRYLKVGDRVRLGIDGLGEQRQRVKGG
jgi:2-keto-4-pentenoate hydratase/2-oxohepta-3-ene-1,7-dioic acid hydratase in catechol pathway